MGKQKQLDEGLPANIDAEKTILGAILLDNECFYDENLDLEADDFSLDSHRRIYLCMNEIFFGMVQGVTNVDIVTLANELTNRKWIQVVGGVSYLASLTEGLPLRPVIEDYIRIVKDKSLLRKMMLIFQSGLARAQDQKRTRIAGFGADRRPIIGNQGREQIRCHPRQRCCECSKVNHPLQAQSKHGQERAGPHLGN